MTSPSREFLRSPFENVFQILPQGHDKALKQAFYNTAATLFVVLASCAGIAVYYILEPFLRPLLWAMLCGTFLFPFKCTLTNVSRRWLRGLKNSGTPLVLGLALLPITTVDCAAEKLGNFWWNYLKVIVAGCVVIPTLYFVFSIWAFSSIFNGLVTSFCFVYEALGYFSALWVWSVVFGYVVVLGLFWSPQRAIFLKLLSLPVWLAVLCHIATIVGPLRVPLVLLGIALVASGFISELGELKTSLKNHAWFQHRIDSSESASIDDATVVAEAEAGSEEKPVPESSSDSQTTDQAPAAEVHSNKLPESESVHDDATESKTDDAAQQRKPTIKKIPPSSLQTKAKRAQKTPPRSLSDYCFIGLLWALVIVHLWIYKFVFLLLPLLLLCYGVKRLGEYLGVWKGIREWTARNSDHLKEKIRHDPRMEILLPKPLRRFGQFLLQGDSKIISTLDSTMDKMMSVLIIVVLIFGVILVTVFAGMEVSFANQNLTNFHLYLLRQ